MTFENHCLEKEIDVWRPLRRLWRGTHRVSCDEPHPQAVLQRELRLERLQKHRWFRVWGLGSAFRVVVSVLRLRVPGLGFRIEG